MERGVRSPVHPSPEPRERHTSIPCKREKHPASSAWLQLAQLVILVCLLNACAYEQLEQPRQMVVAIRVAPQALQHLTAQGALARLLTWSWLSQS